MGANHVGEIASYCEYTRPDYGLITNIGKAHLEGFGGYEGVKKGKGELYDHLRLAEGTAFVMWDDEVLKQMTAGIKNLVRYGCIEGDIRGSLVQSAPFLQVSVDGLLINTQLVGSYNLPNLLAAVAIGKYFKVEPGNIKQALENYTPSNSRSQLIKKDGNTFILDAYNANPTSMKAAIENFEKIDAQNKVLMLGAMVELGEDSLQEHQDLIRLIGQYPWKEVVLVGGDFLKVRAPYPTFENADNAREWLKKQNMEDAYILLKGSRSMQMERVLAD